MLKEVGRDRTGYSRNGSDLSIKVGVRRDRSMKVRVE